MKKVLSGMIAAVMTICMSVSVFASPNSSVSIKIMTVSQPCYI